MSRLNNSDTVAVIGAGTMGAGIAQLAAAAGHPTLLMDSDPAAGARALTNITRGLDRQISRGRMDEAQRDRLLTNIHPVSQLEQLAPARLVIEAIVEDLQVKRGLFEQLEAICSEQTLLASNTSSLSINAIAAQLQRPQNLAGMHFFNPAPVMKLVEVVSGIATAAATAEILYQTAKAWGKRPVHARSTPGFIVNRVARPFYAEALRALEEGAGDCATLDAVMRESGGFRMGPFELMDLIGQDVNYAVTCSVFAAFYNDPRFLPSLTQQALVDGGLLGRKSGEGFFNYAEGVERPLPQTMKPAPAPESIRVNGDPGVTGALLSQWQEAGITIEQGERDAPPAIRCDGLTLALTDGRSATQRAAESGERELVLFDLALDYSSASRIALAAADGCSETTLQCAAGLFQKIGKSVSQLDDIPGLLVMRSVCMLANEAADAVLQQVCDVAAADTAMQMGVNYPLGPLAWADRLGPANVLQVLNNLQAGYGLDRYRPSMLLQRVVHGKRTFHT